MQEGKRFDELQVGDKFTTLSRTVTETDIVNFVNSGGLFEELFLSREFVEKQSVYGKRIAPGALTFVFAEGLTIQTGILHGTGMAFLGTTIKVLGPTFCNDTIRCEIEVSEKRATSKPDRGIVNFTHTVTNQNGQAIMSYAITRMIKR